MDKIDKIIQDVLNPNGSKKRINYKYDFKIAMDKWKEIASRLIGEIELQKDIENVWSNLIKWSFADESGDYNLNKGVYLMGRTGSGKSRTMEILNTFLRYDNIRYIKNDKVSPMAFIIYNSRTVVSDYTLNGTEGLEKYLYYSNICIDDLGAEPVEALYYGTRLNVMTEIIEQRYAKGLTTHFSSNLNMKLLNDRYDDRVYSRIKHSCNIIQLNDKDFRNV
jgi:DNA replication protein DnaC